MVINPFPQNFNWSHVEPHAVTLTWNVQALGAQFAEQIKLTLVSSAAAIGRHKSVEFSFGEITLDELKANTTYDVTIEAIKFRQSRYIYIGPLTTPPTGKLIVVFVMCNSKPNDDMSICKGKGGSVVTSSASASTPVISAVAIACMMSVLFTRVPS